MRCEMFVELQDEAENMMKRLVHWAMVDSSDLGAVKLEGVTDSSSLAVPMMLLCCVEQMLIADESAKIQLDDVTDWAVEEILKHVHVSIFEATRREDLNRLKFRNTSSNTY